jgi:hypothetical protein
LDLHARETFALTETVRSMSGQEQSFRLGIAQT